MTNRMRIIIFLCLATAALFLIAYFSGPHTKGVITTSSLLIIPIIGNLLLAYGGLLLAIYSFPEEMNAGLQRKLFSSLLLMAGAAIVASSMLISDTRLLEYQVQIGIPEKQEEFDSCLDAKRAFEAKWQATRFAIFVLEPVNIGICAVQKGVDFRQISVAEGRIEYESNKGILKLVLILSILAIFLGVKARSVNQLPDQPEDRRRDIYELFIIFFIGVAFQTVSAAFS